MEGYRRLTQAERYQIHALMKAGHCQKEIGEVMERSASTISRELRRNRGLRGYRPRQAQRLAGQRQEGKACRRIAPASWRRAEALLSEDWSPEQISGWLRQNERLRISHEWIYQYVYADKRRGGELHRHLRCQKPRRKRYGAYDRRGQLRDRVSIEERPALVDQRARLGDWEVDTVIGRPSGGVLVTVVERFSRLTRIAWAANKTAEAVKAALLGVMRPVATQAHTLTYDNGKEFAHHTAIARALNAQGYFAHPYHSWERGLNENTNGLIRQYLPKKTSFDSLTSQQVKTLMNKLNDRPRKCLGFKTPNPIFFGINPPVALAS